MAKDDYHVIVYQILAYLYQCLKKGADVDPAMLGVDSIYFKVNGQRLNKRYWGYIVCNLQRSGLIEGVIFADFDNVKHPIPVNWEDCMITPAGIEYLTDNSFAAKARAFLKESAAFLPLIP